MVEVVVTGIGLISALGSLETSWKRLLAGQSAIQLHQPFPDLQSRPLALIAESPTPLTALVDSVVTAALQDANLQPPLLDCAVVIGSSRSYQAQWEQWVEKQVREGDAGRGNTVLIQNPKSKIQNWLDTLPHMPAIATARHIGTAAPVLAPMAACATGIWAIAQGFELLQTGQYQRAIVGAVEAPVTPLTLAGFMQMGALAATGAYPFDCDREGLALGEGGAVFVLETADLAAQRSASVYGRILGFGLTADAYHVSTPDPEGWGAIAAVQQCLARSHLVPPDIDYIHAHGTATQLNDRNEARLMQKLFSQGVPVSSTKGSTGHTLGASGALGVAFSLMALRNQTLPPNVGLRKTEFELNLVRIPHQQPIEHVLCMSFGFGGQNAVVALAA
ncbi:MAG: beta-ketoacyl-ACP synthase, partial [Leptolyngbyaceae bacterium]|nr:beta-ketoacyl-ACP synthase [Leptolyngbyaceae bacterium]